MFYMFHNKITSSLIILLGQSTESMREREIERKSEREREGLRDRERGWGEEQVRARRIELGGLENEPMKKRDKIGMGQGEINTEQRDTDSIDTIHL